MQGLMCNCHLHGLLGHFLQPSKATLTPFLVSQECQLLTVSSFMPLKPISSS